VSANYFKALGIRPIRPGFEPTEESGRNGHPVAVINYRTWKSRYQGDPEIIGKDANAQRRGSTRSSAFAPRLMGSMGRFVGLCDSVLVPASMEEYLTPGIQLENRGARWIEVSAKLNRV